MILKNAEIEGLLNFLMNVELVGGDSRLRTRFCRLLMERQALIQGEHADLIKQFAKFDEEGVPIAIYDEQMGKDIYDIEEREKFQIEYTSLMVEDYIIDNSEERKEMLLKVKNVILDCQDVFKGAEALKYDRWCEIAESIEYDSEK